MAAAFRAGRDAHPGLALPPEAYARHAEACASRRLARAGLPATPDRIARALETSAASDVFLSTACLGAVPGAWERVQSMHGERLAALGASRGASALQAEQEVGELLSHLAVGDPRSGRPPPIDQYDGTGSLFAWLATCLLRRLAARARERRAAKPLPAAAALTDERAPDPAVSAERSDLEERVRAALRGAVGTLSTQERAALVLAHRDGWSGKEVARLLGVGPPRASRLKAQATEKIRHALLSVLRAEGVRGAPDPDTWDALRDAVAAALATVAIPAAGGPPRGEPASGRRPADG
jgi:RNA polymerase sigma factor (sigma-70 family)